MRRRWAWVAAVPVAAVVMLAGSAYRVQDFWYDAGPHDRVDAAAPGQWATLTDEFRDAEGPTTRTVRIRLSGLSETRSVAQAYGGDPGPPPEGTRAVQVGLDFEAATDQELRGCTVQLIDDEGVVYESRPGADPLTQPDSPDRCVPTGREGPALAGFEGQERGMVAPGTERPASWSTRPVMLVAEDARIVRARVLFSYPEYVDLDLS